MKEVREMTIEELLVEIKAVEWSRGIPQLGYEWAVAADRLEKLEEELGRRGLKRISNGK